MSSTYTLSEAMRELGIANRRTIEKWISVCKIRPTQDENDRRFWRITGEDMERIRARRAQMPAARAPQPRHAALPVVPRVLPPLPAPEPLSASPRVTQPTRKLWPMDTLPAHLVT